MKKALFIFTLILAFTTAKAQEISYGEYMERVFKIRPDAGNPNTGMICWNSHCEVLIGSYITYAHYYEINPENGEFTRYADFWHEMSGLIIPDRTGKDDGWASPTDKVSAVKLNKSEINVIRGTFVFQIPMCRTVY